MPEHKSLAEFLSDGTNPILSVRGYEVYELTFAGVTTYPVLNVDDAEIIASGIDLSDAVEYIVTRACMSLIEGIQVS